MSCKTKNCTTTATLRSIPEDISFILDDDNNLVLTIGNRIYKVELNESGGTGGGGGLPTITVPITSNNQVSFNNVIPADRVLLKVFLNGVKQKVSNYTTTGLNGANLLWLDSILQPLETSDLLELEVAIVLDE